MADVREFKRRYREHVQREHTRAIGDLLREIQASAPVDTGALAQSVGATPVSAGASVSRATVYALEKYALFQDQGTRPHVIRPRRARVLRFVQGGRVRFAARVFHPGNPATHFFTKPMADRYRAVLLRRFR